MAAVTLANSAKLTPRVLALVEDAAAAALIRPGQCTVVKGSFVPRSPASGDTHSGDGAADVRVWNLTTTQTLTLVNELRKRNCAAWLRDKAHGGFDPHIHFIVKDQPGLSAGAQWQVVQYDKGRNGLSDLGPDYHPRPTQTPFRKVKWTIVTRVPHTGVYVAPDKDSRRVTFRIAGFPVSYVDVVKGADGKSWLRNAAGNYIAASATAVRV